MITVNGTDLASLGFTARGRRRPGPGVERTATQEVPGTVGAVRLGGAGSAGRLVVEGTLAATDRAELVSRLDQLAAVLADPAVIRLSDHPDREWHGVLQQGPSSLSEIAPQWTSRGAEIVLEWLLPDPTAIARETTILAGPTALLTLGTAPSPIAVDVQATSGGPITQIDVSVRSGSQVLRSLTWAGSLATPSLWSLGDEAHEITVDGANAIDGLAAASEFPEAHPAERADRVVVAVTGGIAQIFVRYRRRWT